MTWILSKSEDKVGQIIDYGKRVIRCKCSRCHSKCQRTDNDHCAVSTEAFLNLSGHRQFLCFLNVSFSAVFVPLFQYAQGFLP